MKVEWSLPARDDLAQIRAHIAADSPRYARQFSERIIRAVRKLHEFPLIGRKVPEADLDNVRELIFQNYRIIYHVEEHHLFVLSVTHGSRDLTRQSNQPWEVG
ncbi:MAG: type II toxin-antitoxin system RelE/ParE family toxin [Pseudomonadota bacterium]|jgi:addiction module RelE/StbE family toxin